LKHSLSITLFFCLAAYAHQTVVPIACADWNEATSAYGRGDYALAYKEIKPLAEKGDPGAQYNLGMMYFNAQGVPQDDFEAVKWFRKAAEQGFAQAQNCLGRMYGDGKGVVQDYVEAVKWYRKAAEQGYGDAQHLLGVWYAMGKGVQQDFVQAYMWFNLAAMQGDSEAQNDRDKVAKMMTPSQINLAQQLASEWKPKGKD
jgi:hypothetical protein